MSKKVILKAGREKSLLRRHPWIFSGAIESAPSYEAGEILPVHSLTGEFLAQAYFHPDTALRGRVLAFHKNSVEKELEKRIVEALALRSRLFDPKKTNAYRLINAEGDGIPGLIVDNYNGHLAVQISTCGIEKLKPFLLETLIKVASPKSIYEKSSSSCRKEEGLAQSVCHLYGEECDQIEILENGIHFYVSIKLGQKTGFFLDQREMRQKIGQLSNGQRVLNCFGYTGGFSLYALRHGAEIVTTVDSCAQACSFAENSTHLNLIDSSKHKIVRADVFDFLEKDPLNYNVIILDPPAFAKKRKDVEAAVRGYRQLNELTLKKMPPRSLLLTCSCSYHIDETLFQQMLFQAALGAKREVRLIGRHIHAPDHPISLYHPEGEYLKSALLYVE